MNLVLRDADYESYLLRLWRSGAGASWHASLQSTATQQIHQFSSIEALFTFLNQRLYNSEISADDLSALLASEPPPPEL